MTGDLTTVEHVKAWLALTGLAIAGITKANPAVVTLQTRPNIPLLTGAQYEIEGVSGMTEVNDQTFTITVIDPLNFSLGVDSTGYGTYIGGGVVGVSDPMLQRLVTACSAYIQAWMNRTIAETAYTETRNGQGFPIMLTLNYPIVSVSSVVIGGQTIQPRPPLAPIMTAQTFGGYVFDDHRIMIDGFTFVRGFQNVVFQYVAGYAATPPDIEQAAIDMIGDWFRYRDRIGKTSEAIEQQSTAFVNVPIPTRAQGILNQYRRVAPIQ